MALRLNPAWRVVGWCVAALLVLVIGYLVVTGTTGSTGTNTVGRTGVPVAVAPEAPTPQGAPDSTGQYSYAGRSDLKASDAVQSEEGVTGAGTAQPMVIRTAMLDMRVDEIEGSVKDVRAAAKRNQATIEQLTVTGGDTGPRPLEGAQSAYPTPANATITLRVPADRLDALSRDVASLGTVITQSSSSDDVTQQYVDMAARLKNLKAEEARLRSFFDRARKVSDLLAVERELSRVRGEIEAMQAQVDYLKRQVARATLTVTMTEPGPVIQPSGTDWGFIEAVRRGVQAAAALLTTLLTVLIAVAPLALLVAAVWLLIRWLVRRRRNKGVIRTNESASPADGDEDRP